MKKLKNKLQKIGIVSMMLACAGCNNWLDIDPVGVQTSDTYWQTKEEAEQVLISSYLQLRTCLPSFFKWGEIRGDELDFGMAHSTSSSPITQGERSLRQLDIRPSNPLCKWSDLYVAIGRANSVIKFAPNALVTDITFTKELCNSFIAEAVFVRSLCYFYLVRTFRNVPYVTEPYADDKQQFVMDVTDGNEILKNVIADMETWSKRCKPGYEIAWQTKGRATSWAFYALMADIYLWQERYDKVHEMYSKIEAGGFELEKKEDYQTLYYPGNSLLESIFELQFRGNIEHQGNDIFSWFNASLIDGRYLISERSKKIFEDAAEEDVRGKEYMYDNRYIGEKYWKYLGTRSRKDLMMPNDYIRPVENRSPNWIFYRYADVILMEAEARAMDGTPYKEVCDFIDNTIRKRAGCINPLTVPDSEEEMLTIILQERQKEFLAEGKQWFDILRIARKQNYKYRNILIQTLVRTVPAKDRPMWKIKLENEYSHYLPIHKSEIEAGHGKLTQNPFYKDVE